MNNPHALPATSGPATRDLLRKELYVIVSTQKGARERLLELLPAHHAYQFELEDSGITFGAGPLYDSDGATRAGLIIVRASSFEEAEAIARRDPFHADGVR